MQAKFSRRLYAFLIDVFIILCVSFSLNLLIPKNHNIVVLESELTDVRSDYLKREIDTSIYLNRYATIQKSLDQQYIPNNILNVILIFGYFVLLPYYWNGKTIGKKLLKIKIVKSDTKEKVSLNDYLLRTLIINGVACFIVSMCVVFLVPDFEYFMVTTIFGIIQFLLVIISSFMIIYRHDKKGVQDLVSGTQVVIEG